MKNIVNDYITYMRLHTFFDEDEDNKEEQNNNYNINNNSSSNIDINKKNKVLKKERK